MKAARKFVHGCATDRLKQAVCAAIVDAARESGARSVADGVETHADYIAVRDMGFDLLQGSLFGKPMEARKFGGALLSKRFATVS
jgi:EAL domain-containing protein (putative c-di-GMP-specific phosphodiesterase class I)